MRFLDDIKKETIIICNSYIKKMILKLNKMLPIKFMTMNEFISKYCFSYDENTIMYLVEKYDVSYEVALVYLKNLIYLDKDSYGIKKLDFLCDIKKDLDDHGLLIYNDNFVSYAKGTDIIICGLRMDKFKKRIFSLLNYREILIDSNEYDHVVYEFETMEDEVEYVAYSICELISNGVSINNIKLTNVDSSYYNTIERIFTLFGLKVAIPYKSLLSSFPLVKKFIQLYKDNDLDYAFNNIDKDNPIYKEIVDLVNKYIKYDNKDLIIYKLEHSNVSVSRYDNEIEIVDYLEYVNAPDDHVFMLGFNDGIIPNSYSDTEYITDNIREYVNLNTTREMNKWLREDIIKCILAIENLTITYKKRDIKKGYYPSTLCSNFEVVKKKINYQKSYSEVFNKIKLTKRIDDYMKYGNIQDDMGLLFNNFKVNYNSFSNKFSGIKRDFQGMKLSYSKMQIYNKCAFRYYLSEILKLDIFEENFSTVIGNMVHYVMEKCLSNNDMDMDKYVLEFLGDRKFSKKEKFFLDKYQDSLKNLLEQIILEKEYSSFDRALYEKKIEVLIEDNVKFIGFIDKILFYEFNGKTYISLVDYKTGNDDISLKYLNYGLNIQLPIYLFLSKFLPFDNKIYTGFYLQKFNINDQDFRLVGYSNSDKDILSIGDSNYDNSKIIKSLKTLKDGSFSRNSKVLSNEEIDKIIDITEDKIKEVINNIKNNNFVINPKISDGKDIGCQFCKFRDICFVSNADKVNIFPQEFGGDE